MVNNMPFIYASYDWLADWFNGGTAWLAGLAVLTYFTGTGAWRRD